MTRDGLPTGKNTSVKNDVADPHPDVEEDYDKIPHPGGTKVPEKGGFDTNSYLHDGKAPPRPKNRGAGPQ